MDKARIIKEIKKIQETYVILQNSKQEGDLNEANTSAKLVEPFLELLGFKKEWHFPQSHVVKGKAIVDIKIRKDGKDILFVEVKKASANKIKSKDLYQLTSYLHSKNIEWGILTNGKEYVLVNDDIKGEYSDKEVLRFNIFNDFDFNTFSFFTKTSLFENKHSYYRKILKQYQILKLKENKNYNSWTRYNDTLESYFMYLANRDERYKEIRYLSLDDFVEFNKHDILESNRNKDRKTINSIATMKNKYAHIKNFYDLFIKNNLLAVNPFVHNFTDEELVDIYGLNYVDESILLSIEDIEFILEGYDKPRKSERNKLMFLLCLYCGLSREQLANINISDIDFDNRTIMFKDKAFVFPEEFINRIKYYVENIREEDFNSDYLFARKYSRHSELPIGISTINEIINKASTALPLNLERKKVQINPEKIKGMLVTKLFDAGFTLEEIMYITGTSLNSLSKYISTESILERTEVKELDERHPYIELFKKFPFEIK